MKQLVIITVITVAVIGLGIVLFMQDAKNPIKAEDILSRSGVHWHPEVAVYIKGEKQEIPSGIGTMQSMHTHDTTGQIHVEKNGQVTKDDVKLATLFKILGKQFDRPGEKFALLVNGKENMEFENYVMQDKDQIEIKFE